MIYRTLQLNRHINIKLLEKEVDGTERLRRSFAGAIGTLNTRGCIKGEVIGKDQEGRPYKDWQIADPEQIREMLKKRKIRPLHPEALEIIKARRNVE